MSRDPGETHVEILGALARELRQFLGLSSSFVRAAAARSGMTVTDLQVLEFLESVGPMTAGQLLSSPGLPPGPSPVCSTGWRRAGSCEESVTRTTVAGSSSGSPQAQKAVLRSDLYSI